MNGHVVIGMVLTPIALVKIGSTGWRIVRYYRGDPGYTARGAPATYLRFLSVAGHTARAHVRALLRGGPYLQQHPHTH